MKPHYFFLSFFLIFTITAHAQQKDPTLSVNPDHLYIEHAGGVFQTDTTLLISNDSGSVIDFEIEFTGGDFLNIGPLFGSIAPGEAVTISLVFNSTGLQPGYYQGQIDISFGTGKRELLEVPVLLRVVPDCCPPPENLTITENPPGFLELNFDPPYLGGALTWDNGMQSGMFGLEDGGSYAVACRFEPDQLEGLDGEAISIINLFVGEISTSTVTAKIWKGVDAAEEITSQEVLVTPGEWQSVELDFPVVIDASEDLWIGYELDQAPGEMPVGTDSGPAVEGYGDMIRIDGEWVSALQQFSTNNNWNIGAVIDYGLCIVQGYNLYSIVSGQSIFIGELSGTYYSMPISPGTYQFMVCAEYYCGESCSEPAGITVGLEEVAPAALTITPNPAKDVVSVQSGEGLERIELLSPEGKLLFGKPVHGQQANLDVNKYPKGLYFLRIHLQNGIVTRKLLLDH